MTLRDLPHDDRYVGYALNESGELVHVDSVPRGRACGCRCVSCAERWHQEPKPEASAKSRSRSPHALRFARVAVTDLCPPIPVTVRLHLANGRRAEIDLMGVEQLEAAIAALERQP